MNLSSSIASIGSNRSAFQLVLVPIGSVGNVYGGSNGSGTGSERSDGTDGPESPASSVTSGFPSHTPHAPHTPHAAYATHADHQDMLYGAQSLVFLSHGKSFYRNKPVGQSKKSPYDLMPPLEERVCGYCGTNKTPLWRRSEVYPILCNACGIRLKTQKQMRR